MKTLLTKIGQEIWDRVVVSNKSTIVAWLLAAGVIAVDQVAQAVAGWHSPYATTAAIVVGLIGTALKNKAKVAANAAAKAATGLALLLFAIGLAAPAFAQDANSPAATPATAAGPLALTLNADLALHLNVSVVAGSYDLTHKAWLGQAPITGLYVLTSKRLLEAGIAGGGSITFDTSSRPLGEVNAGLVSPKLQLTPTLALHGAVLYGRRFGPDAANLVRVAPTLEF